MTFCEPRYSTRRRTERDTWGPRLAGIAQELGTPLMGWQQLVADVGLEFYETDNGLLLPHYREVIVTIPRQNGKTTLVLSWELDRCLLWGRPQRVAYTAQTGGDAVKKLIQDQLPEIQRSQLAKLVKRPRLAKGAEGIDFMTGSAIDVLASTESAGHGRTLDLGVIDEAFKDEDDRREGAMLPAMTTRADAQLLVVSTMGTDTSHYLNRKVARGRELVESGANDAEIAYFEWAADETADIDDPATWISCMPAYGITVTERAIKHARTTMTEGEFRRAYLNQRTATDERIIPLDAWNRVCGDHQPDGPGTVISIDSNPERTHSAIAIADPQGRCELIEHAEGTGWLVHTAVQLAKRWNAPIAYDPAGPAGVFGDDVAREGINTIPVTGREFAHACSFFYDGVVDEKLQLRTHAALNAAAAAARKRISGDSWVFVRRDAASDLSPLCAATLATFAASRGIDAAANVH